jgi:hypothetical protein
MATIPTLGKPHHLLQSSAVIGPLYCPSHPLLILPYSSCPLANNVYVENGISLEEEDADMDARCADGSYEPVAYNVEEDTVIVASPNFGLPSSSREAGMQRTRYNQVLAQSVDHKVCHCLSTMPSTSPSDP